ncbi:MAG TPA: hypothetical protein VG817_07075, partial [Gemmatimonadales bacterium]|nr:hypothetical protein [Gemmatimonadales bacterium]
SAAVILAGVAVTTCADNPTAPNRPGFGTLRVQPAFDQYALFAPLVLNQVRVVVVRQPSDTVVDTVAAFQPTDTELRLDLRIALQSSRETMAVTLNLLSGTTLLFSGTEDVEVRQGTGNTPTSIPVTYSGPGANATSLALAPDTTLTVGATVQMRAIARDIEGVDVGQFYLNWSLVGSAPGASIDASGLLHAPTTPGSFFVRGITPAGLRDSVGITVVPAPSSLAKSSGDGQTAAPGERLPNPLVVLVTGAGGAPVPGVTVSFAATTGGGTVDSATATTDANGLARSGVTLGQAAGVQTFTASSTGLTAVVFSATAQGPGPQTRTWTGAISTDWTNAGNWNGGVPGATDSAVIVAATNSPRLTTGQTTVGALTITGGILQVNGNALSIARNLTITGGGLQMEVDDEVTVGGNATFDGADATNLLTGGELTIAGNFTQLASVSPFSFAASGGHITRFPAGTHTISFASPGAPGGSGFADLEVAGNGSVTLATPVWVRGTLDVNAANQVFTSSTGSRLGVERLVATAPVTFNNVPLIINQATPGEITSQPLTFQNMATGVVQLEIHHPGSASPLTLSNFVFGTTPVAPNGFYLDVYDNAADGNPLVINMVSPTPGTGAPFVRTTGEGAAVNWAPGGSVVRTWTGAVSGDWNTAGNWSNGIPQAIDDVVIDDAAQNEPEILASTTIHSLTFMNEGNTIRLIVTDPAVLDLTGNLLGNVRVRGKVELSGGVTHTVQGQVGSLTSADTVIVASSLGVDDDLTITGGQL